MAGDVSGNIPQLILLRTFGYSRSVPVVLAQWQHLMMSFIHCVAWKSKICHRIDPNPTGKLTIKKNFKFSPQNSLKCFHFEITKQKICHSEAPSPVRSVTTPPHTHPFRLFVPQLWTRVDATAVPISTWPITCFVQRKREDFCCWNMSGDKALSVSGPVAWNSQSWTWVTFFGPDPTRPVQK